MRSLWGIQPLSDTPKLDMKDDIHMLGAILLYPNRTCVHIISADETLCQEPMAILLSPCIRFVMSLSWVDAVFL